MHQNSKRTRRAFRSVRFSILALGINLVLLGLVMVGATSVHAQEAWLLVPVMEKRDSAAPVEAILAPWEQALPRAVQNLNAARIYEQRHSVSSAEPTLDRRERVVTKIDQALEQLALGNLDAGVTTLRVVTQLPELEQDALLHFENIAQKLFDACMMHAYLLARQGNAIEAKQQLRSCGLRFPLHRDGQRGFMPSVHGPPQLKQSFEQAAAELAGERNGALSVSSTKACKVFVNGLSVGETPLRLTDIKSEVARVQLRCGKILSRSHRVVIEEQEARLEIDPRFDSILITSPLLQLRYADNAQRESFTDLDGSALKSALGIDHLAFLHIRARGNAWTVELTALDAQARSHRDLGAIEFSEAAGYDPKQLERLIETLTASNAQALPSPVTLTALPPPPQPTPATPPSAASEERAALSPVLGAVAASVGVIALATSWAMFAERRAFRLQDWGTGVSSDDTAAYARRGAWTLTTLAVGSSVLAVAPYLLLPALDAVPAFAWVIGGLGLAAAAVGIGMTLADEHCGPEILVPRREPCLSVRADPLFGVEIALTALPLMALPFNYLLRSSAASVAVSFDGQRKMLMLLATVRRF